MTYSVCSRCIMDTSLPGVYLDRQGICNHCHHFDKVKTRFIIPPIAKNNLLKKSLKKIKAKSLNSKYDCIFGISGGTDSSYLCFKLKEWGLNPLLLHVDGGWNTPEAVSNINTVVDQTGFDLITEVVEWETMRALQLSYLRSGVYNLDVPQDHVFMASLYHYAIKYNIRSIISGHNFATESTLMPWQHSALDLINLKSIMHTFSPEIPLKGYKTITLLQLKLLFPLLYRLEFYRLLNYVDYNKESAIDFLKTVGWQQYNHKHGESVFTRFYQDYILPTKYNIDKRKVHFTSLIHNGFIARELALEKLTVDNSHINLGLTLDIDFFCKKLGIEISEFVEIINAPIKPHTVYKNWDNRLKKFSFIKYLLQPFTVTSA